MEFALLALVFAVVLLAAVAHTVTGFGFALVAVPLLVLVLDVREVVVIVALLALCSSLFVVRSAWGNVPWPTLRYILLGAFAGMPLGLAALLAAPADVLRLFAGVGALAMAVAIVAGVQVRAAGARSELLVGLTSGVLATSTSLNGPPVVIYLQVRRLSPAEFRSALAVFFIVSNIIALSAFAAGGVISSRALLLAAGSFPAVVLASWLGQALLGRIDQQMFRRMVLALLSVTALVAITTSLARLLG